MVATGFFIEVASLANDGSVGNGRILRFVLRSLQGKTFRSAVVVEDAAALDRDAACSAGLSTNKYKFIRCKTNKRIVNAALIALIL